jgi:hypothetical protein
VVSDAKKYFATFKHDYVVTLADSFFSINSYHSKYKSFADMSKKEQSHVTKLAKEQYEAKKIKTLENYKLLKDKCDHIFHDDKQYKKFIPELEHLYYCQATTALQEYYSKKVNGRAVSNSKYKARAMSYSTISCD